MASTMVIMISATGATQRKWSWALVVLAIPARAVPADWTIAPSVRLAERYTDNVNLSPQARARSAWSTELAPALAVTATGPTLSLRLDYALQERRNTAEALRRTQLLDSSAHGELVPDWFTVDARAGISQQNLSAFGPQITDPGQDSANRTTTHTLSLAPTLKHDFRGLATAELRYAYDSVRSDRLYDVHNHDVRLTVSGDNGGRGWQWQASADRNATHDAAMVPVINSDAAFTLRVPLDGRVTAFGTTGYEKADYQAVDNPPQGRYWSAGAAWNPSVRTSVTASVGRRHFGQTHSLDLQYRMHAMYWTLNYKEDITTTSAQFLSLQPDAVGNFLYQLWASRIPDPQLRLQTVNAFLRLSQLLGPYAGNVNYFSHNYFLQKQWHAATVYSGARSTLALGLSATQRAAQTRSTIDSPLLPPGQLAADDHTRQRAAQAGWSWRLSPRDSVSLTGSYSATDAVDTGRRDRNRTVTVNLTRQLQPRLTATLDLRHANHRSNAGGNYRENGAGAALILLF